MSKFFNVSSIDGELDIVVAVDHILAIDLEVEPGNATEQRSTFATFTMRDDLSFRVEVDEGMWQELYDTFVKE